MLKVGDTVRIKDTVDHPLCDLAYEDRIGVIEKIFTDTIHWIDYYCVTCNKKHSRRMKSIAFALKEIEKQND